MITISINGRSLSLVTDHILTDTAMGMIYRYDDIPDVRPDAIAFTAAFQGIDITRAIKEHFNLPTEEFERAGRICNERLEVCALQHNPLLILTPRVALQEAYSAEKARVQMLEILKACHLYSAKTLRLCHFAMMTTDDALDHLPGVRNAVREWRHERPTHILMDVPHRHMSGIENIISTDSG